ncbi:UPF0047 protein C4A8.02c-like isoform X9 [Phragmites australis]|uniref:UPF0047 protein C4A8.02c-like isoform X9 n=1 Tax=Phragmites australis TaxID=29695 RepID=UPI002D767591|nr:UPF0047 protein C4A8.02c-like isoform X9 [Phragmites australis]
MSPPPPRRRRLAPWPPGGPIGPSSSRRSAAAATSSPPSLLQIVNEIRNDLAEFKCGMAHLFAGSSCFVQHTSASLTINENYDSDVQADTETFLSRIVPEGLSAPWRHTIEGSDDMPAHIKSSMFGCALTILITNWRLNTGTWQGIWLCEHRDYATPRKIVITLNGI